MKFNILSTAVAALLSATAFSACDNIDIDDRYTGVDKPVLPAHAVPKTLLIQEFTGMNCMNCPSGAQAIHSIQEANPGRVIAVGMHPVGGGPNTEPIIIDLRCDEAQVMYNHYMPSGFPCAVFNGTVQSTTYDNWLTLAIDQLKLEAYMTIEATTAYDAASRGLTVDYEVAFTSDFNEPVGILVWVMENGIVGWQNNNGTYVGDYVHNHVLRASANGDWGTKLGDTFENGDKVSGSASITLNNDWVAENCQVVVYTFRQGNKAIEQACLVDVVSPTQAQ